MLRNKQEEKQKALRRLRIRQDELDWKGVEYVPVEKPFFMGWDVYVDLSESGKRRRDAPDLMQVLHLIEATKKRFTKCVKYIRYLRKNGYSYEVTENSVFDYRTWTAHKQHEYLPYYHQTLRTLYITESEFEHVKGPIRKYFYRTNRYWWRTYDDKVYKVDESVFPTYELVYKVEKAYANARGIPKGEEWGEYERIRDILYNSNYYSSRHGYNRGYEGYSAYLSNIRIRKRWKQLLTKLKQTDFSYEAEEYESRYLKDKKFKMDFS